MKHRIGLSTTLLIAVRSTDRKTKRGPKVAGINIDRIPALQHKKSRHMVDALGNIIPTASRDLALS